MTKKKRFKDSSQPFILDHTLGFLSRPLFFALQVVFFLFNLLGSRCCVGLSTVREGVPKERVTLFVANEEEMTEYRKALEATCRHMMFQSHQSCSASVKSRRGWDDYPPPVEKMTGLGMVRRADSSVCSWCARQPPLG